jgi:hypothetical protein
LLHRRKAAIKFPAKAYESNSENTNTIDQSFLKKSKKANVRKIIKGRPEIKRFLKENKDRVSRQRTVDYADCIFADNSELRLPCKPLKSNTDAKTSYRKSEMNSYVHHTIV